MKHKLLHISSKDKQAGTNSNFSLNLSHHYWLQAAKSVVVKHVTIPNVFYNVDANNNTFTYEIAGAPSTVVVDVGQYSISDLLGALTVVMVADGVVGFTATLDAITRKVSFTSTTAIEYLSAGNAMAGALGITQGSVGDVTAHTAAHLPSLEGIRNIVIASSSLGENNYLASDQKIADVIALVPMDQPFGGVVHYVSQHSEIDDFDTLSQRNGKNISQIDIRVIDTDTNQIVDLTNHDIDIVVKIYY